MEGGGGMGVPRWKPSLSSTKSLAKHLCLTVLWNGCYLAEISTRMEQLDPTNVGVCGVALKWLTFRVRDRRWCWERGHHPDTPWYLYTSGISGTVNMGRNDLWYGSTWLKGNAKT